MRYITSGSEDKGKKKSFPPRQEFQKSNASKMKFETLRNDISAKLFYGKELSVMNYNLRDS